ncbi:MAG TPA: hypothetical protein DCZ43_00375 [candidate division Zixibacteria bacterium]|nr:hypothetical protein [candidate division Zixibacteria bacterium]
MKNAVVLFVLLDSMVLGSLASAQTTDSRHFISVSGTKSSARTLSEAEQATAVDASDNYIESQTESIRPKAVAEALIPDIYKPEREKYIATLEIVHLAWPRLMGGSTDQAGARLSLGVTRPHYSYKKELRMMGNLDLKIESIYHKILNSARLTLVYDMRRSLKKNDTRMRVLVDKVVFKVGVPVGGW